MKNGSDVMRSLGTAVRAMRARMDRALRTEGLRLGQYQVMRLLWERDGLTPREISDGLAVEMPTVTRTVQRMERDGLVRREAHPDDARSVKIYLTPHAARLRAAVDRIRDEETERALRGFSLEERAALGALLERIAGNAQG